MFRQGERELSLEQHPLPHASAATAVGAKQTAPQLNLERTRRSSSTWSQPVAAPKLTSAYGVTPKSMIGHPCLKKRYQRKLPQLVTTFSTAAARLIVNPR